ncbi:MAG: phosphoserine phosphatase SerB [Alphaproteobacteria bacterium]
MENVLTLIAGSGTVNDSTVARVRSALLSLAADIDRIDWLAPGEACDLPFDNLAPDQADAAARAALDGLPVDVVAQPVAGRRKMLLVADMDSTFVTEETLDEIAAHAGLKERIAAITARAMNGELDFAEALRERVGMLAGLPEDVLETTWRSMHLMPGGPTVVRTMRANGAHTVLVSGGFKYFTTRVREACGFHDDVANDFVIEDGRLSGRVIEPIVDRHIKLDTLKRVASERQIPLTLTASVGDGANDLPMLKASGLGVAYHAKRIVTASAPHRVDHADLTALLYAQGYHREEFSG